MGAAYHSLSRRASRLIVLVRVAAVFQKNADYLCSSRALIVSTNKENSRNE